MDNGVDTDRSPGPAKAMDEPGRHRDYQDGCWCAIEDDWELWEDVVENVQRQHYQARGEYNRVKLRCQFPQG